MIISASFIFYAHEYGITGRTLKGPQPGCTCHSENNSPYVGVVIDGPEVLTPGETADYTVTITGGSLVRGGTNIAVSHGNLTPGDGMQKAGSEITHTAPKIPQDGSVVFRFMYTAPDAPATVTMFANGNSVNYNGLELGDYWNYAESKTISVGGLSGAGQEEKIHNSFTLSQNFPNPFNPSTKIKFLIPETSFVQLYVYNVLGNRIEVLVNDVRSAGVYETEFDGNNYPSGIYLYKIICKNFTETKKMILLR